MLRQWSQDIVVQVLYREPVEPDDTGTSSVCVHRERVRAELVTDDYGDILPSVKHGVLFLTCEALEGGVVEPGHLEPMHGCLDSVIIPIVRMSQCDIP